MTKRAFILSHAEARQRAIEAVRTAPDGYGVTVAEPLPPELRGKRKRDRAPVDQETGEVMA